VPAPPDQDPMNERDPHPRRRPSVERSGGPSLDGPHAPLLDSAPAQTSEKALGSLTVAATMGELAPDRDHPVVGDERIERLARAAAEDAPSSRAAELQYEWRRNSLLRERELFNRDRRMAAERRARLKEQAAV
jgi:hypothetical protein